MELKKKDTQLSTYLTVATVSTVTIRGKELELDNTTQIASFFGDDSFSRLIIFH